MAQQTMDRDANCGALSRLLITRNCFCFLLVVTAAKAPGKLDKF